MLLSANCTQSGLSFNFTPLICLIIFISAECYFLSSLAKFHCVEGGWMSRFIINLCLNLFQILSILATMNVSVTTYTQQIENQQVPCSLDTEVTILPYLQYTSNLTKDISSFVYSLTMFDVCHMFVLKYYLRPIFNSF